MDVNYKFAEWFLNLTELEKTDNIKKFAIRLSSLRKSLDKATKAELDYGFNRIGIRGGKFTSLNAKADNCARMYEQCKFELKYMTRNL